MSHRYGLAGLAVTGGLVMAMLACTQPVGGAFNDATATALAQTADALIATAIGSPVPTATPSPPDESGPASPTPTGSPTLGVTPATPGSEAPTPCVNQAQFDTDITVPDDTHFAAGQAFVKTWRMRNTGTCTWETTYWFRFLGGDKMSAPDSVALSAPVPPGGTADISVSFTAPKAMGTYLSRWQLAAPDGSLFGQKPYVRIVVP